jgi:hypothetical protein
LSGKIAFVVKRQEGGRPDIDAGHPPFAAGSCRHIPRRMCSVSFHKAKSPINLNDFCFVPYPEAFFENKT